MGKKWLDDIRKKTKNMAREEKLEYILTYYWYHILLACVFLGLCALVVYHINWGNREKDFSLVLVNQEVDFSRDKAVAQEFAAYSGISPKRVSIDSDYLISYGDVKLNGVNESSYEKFFFNWMSGTMDGAIMPESYIQYCKSQDGTFAQVSPLLEEGGMDTEGLGPYLYLEHGEAMGIYMEKTKLASALKYDPEDPAVLVFPQELPRRKACIQFLKYVLEEK